MSLPPGGDWLQAVSILVECLLSSIIVHSCPLPTVDYGSVGGTASGHKGIPEVEINLLYRLVLLLYLL